MKNSPNLGSRADGYLRRRWTPPFRRLGPLLVGGIVVWSIASLFVGDRGLARLLELRWREEELSAELHTMKKEAENLKWQLAESGPMAVERPAREKFSMQRPGEIVYYFPRTDAPQPAVDAEEGPTPEPSER